jgi:hypothetical protein
LTVAVRMPSNESCFASPVARIVSLRMAAPSFAERSV